MKIEKFEDMDVWKQSRALVSLVYKISQKNQISRDHRFIDQIRGAAISVMSNIAEGFERKSNKEFERFLFISKASCGEVRSLLYVALDVGYLNEDEFRQIQDLVLNISRSLSGFIKYLSNT